MGYTDYGVSEPSMIKMVEAQTTRVGEGSRSMNQVKPLNLLDQASKDFAGQLSCLKTGTL